jgi:hypothetical protein
MGDDEVQSLLGGHEVRVPRCRDRVDGYGEGVGRIYAFDPYVWRTDGDYIAWTPCQVKGVYICAGLPSHMRSS